MAGNKTLRFGFVGAGYVNFGGSEGPWDHASRLEKMEGVQVVAIADVDTEKAKSVLTSRRANPQHAHVYDQCKIYASTEAMLEGEELDAVIIGIPPVFRGSLKRDVELACIKKGIHAFIEKPLSVTVPEEFGAYVDAVVKAADEHHVIASVGYMFRYHKAVRKMKEIIANHGGKVLGLIARYYNAYEFMDRPFWWDISQSGGPVVEQATHFLDLARYLAGDADLSSVHALHIPASDQPGDVGCLTKISPHCDAGLPSEKRAPRATIAGWKFEDGGLGQLMHMVALHGKRYKANLEVVMDGLCMHLYEPYLDECQLRVRGLKEDKEEETIFSFGDADPYYEELYGFIQAIRSGDASTVASTYSDAAKTYFLSWAIRRNAEAGEKAV